jgi:hypothetical protein
MLAPRALGGTSAAVQPSIAKPRDASVVQSTREADQPSRAEAPALADMVRSVEIRLNQVCADADAQASIARLGDCFELAVGVLQAEPTLTDKHTTPLRTLASFLGRALLRDAEKNVEFRSGCSWLMTHDTNAARDTSLNMEASVTQWDDGENFAWAARHTNYRLFCAGTSIVKDVHIVANYGNSPLVR